MDAVFGRDKKKQLQGGENCMTNFTIKLSSPNDYGEQVNQVEGGGTYVFIVVFSMYLTHYSGRVTQICVFNTVKLGTSASSR